MATSVPSRPLKDREQYGGKFGGDRKNIRLPNNAPSVRNELIMDFANATQVDFYNQNRQIMAELAKEASNA